MITSVLIFFISRKSTYCNWSFCKLISWFYTSYLPFYRQFNLGIQLIDKENKYYTTKIVLSPSQIFIDFAEVNSSLWLSAHWCQKKMKIICISRVTKKSSFTITGVLSHFLHAILCHKHIIPLKQSPIVHFAIVANDGLLWLNSVTWLTVDLWRTRGTSIVTSYSVIVFARANWRKAISTGE